MVLKLSQDVVSQFQGDYGISWSAYIRPNYDEIGSALIGILMPDAKSSTLAIMVQTETFNWWTFKIAEMMRLTFSMRHN